MSRRIPPCPVPHEEGVLVSPPYVKMLGEGAYCVHCPECGASGPQASTGVIAIDLWSSRQPPRKILEMMRGLRSARKLPTTARARNQNMLTESHLRLAQTILEVYHGPEEAALAVGGRPCGCTMTQYITCRERNCPARGGDGDETAYG